MKSNSMKNQSKNYKRYIKCNKNILLRSSFPIAIATDLNIYESVA